MAKRGMLSQLGVADESTYGTAVAASKWFEFRSESIKLDIATIESQGIRSGRFNTARTGTYARHKRGAGGDIELEVMNKDFAWWFKHMLGAVGTTGPTETAYVHTGTIASLVADSFTLELGRDDQRFVYEGGKVMEWELTAEVGEILLCTLTCDFEDESTSGALSSPSYPSGLVPFSFLNGTLTIGGSSTDVRSATVRGNNNLANERYFIRSSGLKKEPIDQGREYGGDLEAEFTDMTAYNRFVNGTEAALVLTFVGGLISGAQSYTFTVNAPVVRFDGETPVVEGPDIITQPLPFRVLDDSLTLSLKTNQAAP
jgi:hypothetical protein